MKRTPLRLLIQWSAKSTINCNYQQQIFTSPYKLNPCVYLCRNQIFNFSTKAESNASSINPEIAKVPKNNNEASVVTQPSEGSTNNLNTTESADQVEMTQELSARQEYYERRHGILQMDVSDYENTRFVPKGALQRDKETARSKCYPGAVILPEDEKYSRTDKLAFIQADLDFRPEAIKRWWKRQQEKHEIEQQRFHPQRNSILGHDLAAAHFFVFRKGKVKFLGQSNWATEYRTDTATEEDEEDLPDITPDVCSLPTQYDPNFLIEAVDCSDMTELRYEGLENLDHLPYCRSLKFENCIHFDAWCMDKIAAMYADRLLYLDISGCTQLTEGALCAVARFKNLKTLVVRNLPQIKNLDIICAWLEDKNPELEIVGTNYEAKMRELELENERLNKKIREEEAATITIESTPRTVPEIQSN